MSGLEEGDRLGGRYRIESQLGEGGMGTVYLARDEKLPSGRRVVIKCPRRQQLGAEGLARFAQEIRRLAELDLAGVVRILDVGDERGRPYAVLQYLKGGSLRDRAQDRHARRPGRPAWEPGEVCEWLLPIARTLDLVHGASILHRDVKPDNILFDEQDTVFVADFGIAKSLNVPGTLSEPGSTPGTPRYMGPEVADSDPRLTAAYDQYALAIMVYEALSGKLPHDGPDRMQPFLRRERPPMRLGEALPGCPQRLEAALHRALAIDPRQRFQSCGDLAAAVRDATVSQPGPAPPPQPVESLDRSSAAELSRTSTKALGLTVLVLLVGILVVAVQWWPSPPETDRSSKVELLMVSDYFELRKVTEILDLEQRFDLDAEGRRRISESYWDRRYAEASARRRELGEQWHRILFHDYLGSMIALAAREEERVGRSAALESLVGIERSFVRYCAGKGLRNEYDMERSRVVADPARLGRLD